VLFVVFIVVLQKYDRGAESQEMGSDDTAACCCPVKHG